MSAVQIFLSTNLSLSLETIASDNIKYYIELSQNETFKRLQNMVYALCFVTTCYYFWLV